MAKNWIKKAINHPGRCTPGSPNYDCPKGSPQWNLAQRFKHGDLHKKEHGGMTASDNVDMNYYSNPLKYFAAMGINISDDDCLECGGKVYANNGLNIDSTLNANKNLNWVDRLYQKNTPTIFLPGESHPSTHYMENADNFVYPTIIQNEDGKLEYLGNKAYDYAMKTNTAIKFKTPEEAEYFAKNYKKGKGVLKKFNMGGKIEANNGANAKKQIPNSEQVKAWNKAKHDLKLQLQKEGKDISYLDHNLDYAKTFLQGYNKQNNFIFGEDKSPEEIVKFWQEYNNDVYSDPTYKSSLLPFEQTYQKSVENNERNDSINPNNRSNPDGVLGSFTINDITPLRVLKKKGTDESGEAVIILNPYSPEKFTIEKNSIIKKNTPVNNEQLLQELYTVPNYGVQPGTSPSFQNGGNVIQPSQSENTQLIKNQKYIVDDANDYRLNLLEQTSEDYMKGWINSPMYKKMFDKSKQKGEEPIPESWITDTKWGRKPILTKEGVAGSYNSHSDSLYIKNNILTNKYQSYATGVHEISHSSDNGGRRIPLNDVKKMKDYAKIDREKYYKELPWYKKFLYDETELNNYVKEDLDFKKYVGSPTETRARLNVIRALGKKQGIYDPYISPINSKQLKKIKFENDGYNPMDQLKLIYSEEEILDMLNSISKNNDKKIIQGKFGTTAETIYSMSEQPKVILTPDDIKAESGFNFQKYFPMERDIPVDTTTSYNRDIDRFAWKNTLQNLPEIQKQQQVPNQQIDSSYYTQKTPKGYLNVYDKSNRLIGYSMDNKTIVKEEPNFEDGGIVKAWIQKFSNGGYIADEGFPVGQELTQPTTNYYNWGNYGNQNSFLTSDQINQKPFQNPYQNMNLQQPNVPQFNIPKGQEIEPLTSIGAQKMTPDLQGLRNRVNQSMQDIAPESKSPMNMNAVNMGLDVGGKSLDATANLLGSLGKDNSKAKAFGQGASGAMKVSDSITKPFKSIPIAGKAIDTVGKTLGFFIGGALEARRQGIENEEMDKYNKVQEYTSRNTQTAQQPSYYGQYMSKYGSNIKNLEQRLIDDIFSDYDKFMKLT